VNISMVALSDEGNVRSSNEDAYGIYEADHLAIVCDGMGGHKAGAWASRIAVETIAECYLHFKVQIGDILSDIPLSVPPVAAPLIDAVRLANLRIHSISRKVQEAKGMGTTASVLAFDEGQICIAHVGDSRVYRLRANQIECLTEDHTWLNELIQDKEIEEDQAQDFASKNVITRALGLSERIKVDVRVENIADQDVYLLCTDGLSDSLDEETIKEIILQDIEDLDLTVVSLVAKAKKVNGKDNITAVLLKAEDVTESAPSITPVVATIAEETDEIHKREKRFLSRHYHKVDSSDITKIEAVRKTITNFFKLYVPKPVLIAVISFVLGFITHSVLLVRDTNTINNNPILHIENHQATAKNKVDGGYRVQWRDSQNQMINANNNLSLTQL